MTDDIAGGLILHEASLASFFGSAYPKIAAFAGLLVELGIPRGLVGPREAPRIWDRHILNCAGVCQILPTTGTILDLGSGAGLPGLVIAIMRPTQPVILLESLQRRTNWLTEMAATLELPNVTVIRGRAGENLKLPLVESVTARAVAPLTKLAAWSAPLLVKGGSLYALKGDTVTEELASVAADKKLARSWVGSVEIAATLPGVPDTVVAKLQLK